LSLIFVIFFISVGDRILPSPLSDYSRNTRNGINQFIIGLFPDNKVNNPHRRTEDAVDKLEQQGR
jgi:hypothetical protein